MGDPKKKVTSLRMGSPMYVKKITFKLNAHMKNEKGGNERDVDKLTKGIRCVKSRSNSVEREKMREPWQTDAMMIHDWQLKQLIISQRSS